MPMNPFLTQILAALGLTVPPSMVGGFPTGALASHVEAAPDSTPGRAAPVRKLRPMTMAGRALAGMTADPNETGGFPASHVEGPTGEASGGAIQDLSASEIAGPVPRLQDLTASELAGPVAREGPLPLPPHVSRLVSFLQALGLITPSGGLDTLGLIGMGLQGASTLQGARPPQVPQAPAPGGGGGGGPFNFAQMIPQANPVPIQPVPMLSPVPTVQIPLLLRSLGFGE